MRGGVRAIEDFFRARYGRGALFLPSGRLALYLAFRQWLHPGDRVLMSPVTDDVVFFTVLAAGLVPVLGPVDPHTGNLDPDATDDRTWAGLRAVMTTNLYGMPDRMDVLEKRCRQHGLLLLEDACHALDSRFDGRRIGTFGPVAAYSLQKHLGIAGGVLAFSEEGRRDSLARRALEEVRSRSFGQTTAELSRILWRTLGPSGRAPTWLASLRDQVAPRSDERPAHRMPYALADVVQAQKSGGGLDPFDRWVRMDAAGYRTWPLRLSIRAGFQQLETFEEQRRLRLAGVRKLLDLGFTPPSVRLPRETALLRVPLFVQEREKVIAQLAHRGLTTEYIYDPPLDLYAPGLADALPSPPAARIWSRDVLPVNPLLADRFIACLSETPGLCVPLEDVP